MTRIQIITVEYEEVLLRAMIENVNGGHYRVYSSIRYKDKASSCFTVFEPRETLYGSAREAFESVLYNLEVFSVENQLSDLLSTKEIIEIAKCEKIKEV